MRGGRLDRAARGAALVIAMATAQLAHAEDAADLKNVEALVPLPPESSSVPPPTAADTVSAGAAAAAAPAEAAATTGNIAAPRAPDLFPAEITRAAPPAGSDAASVPTAPAPAPSATSAPVEVVARPPLPAAQRESTSQPEQATQVPPSTKADPGPALSTGTAQPIPTQPQAVPKGEPAVQDGNQPAPAARQESSPAAASSSERPRLRSGAASEANASTAAPPNEGTGSPPGAVFEGPPKTEPPPAAAPAKEEQKPAAIEVAPADPVAQKLQEILTGRLDHIVERRKERAAIEAFYAARQYAPVWISAGIPNARAQSAIARLHDAEADGLDSSDYPVPDFKAAADKPDALAEAELKLTNSVLAYARHAQIGRVHFSRVSADIEYELVPPEPAEVMAQLLAAADAGEALRGFNPPHQGYKALRDKLAQLRGRNGENRPARIDGGPVLKPGMRDDRVPLLRERLGVSADPQDTTYSKPLAEAVKKFQRQHGLSASGNLNSATVEALNGPRPGREADVIIANMERWRWLPRDLGKAYVMVNIPDYTLRVVRDGATLWKTKVVVGKPSMPTPLLSQPMRYITVNPTWNVPPSIVYNEYLPVLQQDPMALARAGLRVEYGRDGSVHVSQPPGDKNALGRIRFNFPNKFLVYQHDTPDKYMFAHDKRAYSHGCMRVENPLKYAEVLLSITRPEDGYTTERLHRMFGSGEQDIQFHTLVPVHLTYQTAFVDEAGKLELREDIYGRDAHLLAVLKGEDRRVADIAVERHRAGTGAHYHATRLLPRQQFYPSSSFGGFFGRMFR
jgi:L,D-transpeptidase YcbB